MRRTMLIIWTAFVEGLSLITLMTCVIYLITKAVAYFQFNDIVVTLLFAGGMLLIWYIHESLFRSNRKRVNKALKLLEK